ncbi:uncharacterized protein RHIMIDRAFT_41928 [Rhizopus microsporus ATCC 52813]|uniref:WRKY domain-containing protein n=2 Tax=Rhizopus microsporus TaxID=58291 RepID=A0A2G4SMQ5_RHIZD|nr:uncharacterized protein RHIMIDRAFT_41928 [Rhizopus microsporus ATCC 52813]PHZ10040.1 hypothetical protein RHIMIDRAFT_41928 [Rhizopus microsporus ATCC 52813]
MNKETAYYKMNQGDLKANKTDLQAVISKYQSDPELLKLILISKVEEDKRRTEEARLRSKEIDLYLSQRYHYPYRRIIPNEIIHKNSNIRRKRSIQAISKVIETHEFPFDDGFFWKTNGNTLQKRTGLKSIYFKCASKDCPVNKTVIEQENGKYMIKYRGQHVSGCNKIEHVKDV